MIVDGVPESITRADYVRLIESVGLSSKGLRQLEFRMEGIYATVLVPKSDGHGSVHIEMDPMASEDKPATHRVYIPVCD